jgi:hypothetical protein
MEGPLRLRDRSGGANEPRIENGFRCGSRDPNRAGRCPEAQADGVPCGSPHSDCERCDRAETGWLLLPLRGAGEEAPGIG